MENITFLFGAGAEQNLGLSGGEEFAINLLGVDENNKITPNMNNAISKYFSPKAKDSKWYPDYTKSASNLAKLAKGSIRKNLLEHEFDSKTAFENEVKAVYAKIFDDKSEKAKTLSEDECRRCLEHIQTSTSYMGVLDGYFHTIISPIPLGKWKFWNVINCYTRAYLLLTSQIKYKGVDTPGEEEYLSILNNPTETYKKLELFAEKQGKTESYYSIIRDELMKKSESGKYNVITVNYTPLCEKNYRFERCRYCIRTWKTWMV